MTLHSHDGYLQRGKNKRMTQMNDETSLADARNHVGIYVTNIMMPEATSNTSRHFVTNYLHIRMYK